MSTKDGLQVETLSELWMGVSENRDEFPLFFMAAITLTLGLQSGGSLLHHLNGPFHSILFLATTHGHKLTHLASWFREPFRLFVSRIPHIRFSLKVQPGHASGLPVS